VPQGVTGDPGRVAEALELMLDDALMATEAGRVIARLRCDERNPDSAVVTVEIEAEGPFDALTPPPALEACRALATEVGGELGVERRGGRRAAWLRLPLDLCQLSPPASAGDRVLVVEDNPVNQRLICSMLTKLGLAYDVADNGAEAVRAFRERAYSLVLMDCMMPEMDGYEATRAIRGMEPAGAHATIIAVTACALPEDRERCLEAGMDDYLTKPLTLGTLSETLESWRPQRAAS
jgi:CheY-like chemotaxis protein